MLTQEQVQAYLDRIGFADEPVISKEVLDELVFCHQKTVPFETYDVHVGGITPSLAEADLYQKIVGAGRGGYCFEINKAFEMLLAGLGFDVRPCLCRAVRGRDGRMPINHRGVLVNLDGVIHFVDVGFGGPLPAGSLVLEDGVEQDIRGEFYTPRSIDGMWWAIDRVTRAKFDFFDDALEVRKHTELELCLAVVEDIDFNALNVAFSQPGVLFREALLANIRTETGHRALKDMVLNIRDNGEKTTIEFADEAELKEGLLTYFGIAVD